MQHFVLAPILPNQAEENLAAAAAKVLGGEAATQQLCSSVTNETSRDVVSDGRVGVSGNGESEASATHKLKHRWQQLTGSGLVRNYFGWVDRSAGPRGQVEEKSSVAAPVAPTVESGECTESGQVATVGVLQAAGIMQPVSNKIFLQPHLTTVLERMAAQSGRTHIAADFKVIVFVCGRGGRRHLCTAPLSHVLRNSLN
jgi:hypothetical protein